MDADTRLAISKLELHPGDVILIHGDFADERLEEIAQATGHFVIVIPAGQTIEAIPEDIVRDMFTQLDEHKASQ